MSNSNCAIHLLVILLPGFFTKAKETLGNFKGDLIPQKEDLDGTPGHWIQEGTDSP